MIEIDTKVLIRKKSPDKVFKFLLLLDANQYRAMSPTAHKDFKIIKPVQSITGSIYYFHEVIGKLDLHHKWLVTDAKENARIIQKAQTSIPITIEIYLEKVSEGTELTQKILIGFTFLGIKKIVDWFAKEFILTPKQIQLLHNHTKEEFSSLEKLIRN